MKLITLVNAHNLIESFSENEDMGFGLTYLMAKFVAETQAATDSYNKDLRKVASKYGVEDEAGRFNIPESNAKACEKDLDKLQNSEVAAPAAKLPFSKMEAAPKMSMRQVYMLLDFIDENA